MDSITFTYLLADQEDYKTLKMTEEEYFDLEENEIPSVNSVPKYCQPYEYLPYDTSQIIFLHLIIAIEKEILEFRQTFWSNGQNFLTERAGTKTYRELIISSCLNTAERVDETIRIVFGEKNIYPILHSFIKTNADGTQEEDLVDTSLLRKRYKRELNG